MAFVVNNVGCLHIFEYDKASNDNSLKQSINPFKCHNSQTIHLDAIGCEIMNHKEKGELLVCFV